MSIVLPVYNGEKYLAESIESVLQQTYQNWELIIIDDCSSDSTPNIVKSYVLKDDRIHYYRNEKNKKLPGSLNAGFKKTKGDYLTWTSDDNRYRSNAIERLLAVLKQNNCQFVFSAYSIMDENGVIIKDRVLKKNAAKELPVHNVVGACFMYTRTVYEKVGDYDTELFLTEDFDYWQRIYAEFGAVYIQDILYDYRMHSASLTDTKNEDVFQLTLCKTVIKNRHLFGHFGVKLKYFYYKTLSSGKEIAKEPNIYKRKYKLYSILYYLLFFYPEIILNKLKRVFGKV